VPTYSNDDFERIATALGVSPHAVVSHRNEFEAAAVWYRADCSSPRRVPPSTIIRQANMIAAAAKKLLGHLEIYDYRDALKGPPDLALLEALALAEDGSARRSLGRTPGSPSTPAGNLRVHSCDF
jgi:hypothetical protein